MNRYQKALYIYSHLEKEDTVGEYTPLEYAKARNALQELVEKATPKKVNNATREDYMETGYKNCCPTCGAMVGTITPHIYIEHDRYCCICGQKLDWSEEEC